MRPHYFVMPLSFARWVVLFIPRKKQYNFGWQLPFFAMIVCYLGLLVIPPQLEWVTLYPFAIVVYCGAYWHISGEGIGKAIFVFCNYLILFLFATVVLTACFNGNDVAKAGGRIVIFAVCIYLYIRYIRDKFNQITAKLSGRWSPINTVTGLFAVALSYTCVNYVTNRNNGEDYLFFICSVFILTIAVYRSIFRNIYYMKIAMDVQDLQLQDKLLRTQLERVSKSEQEATRCRHDARHHSLLVKEFAKKRQIDQLLEYLNDYDTQVEASYQQRLCKEDGEIIYFATMSALPIIKILHMKW